MPMRDVNLTAELDALVEEVVEAGLYQNASEVVRDAVRGLRQRLAGDTLKLDPLRTQLQAGIAALDRGDFIEIADADLDTAINDLAASGAR